MTPARRLTSPRRHTWSVSTVKLKASTRSKERIRLRDVSVRTYRLNRFLHDLIIPEHRRKFLADPEAAFEEAGLTEKERAMVRNRDWREMIHYGVIFFMLEKLGAVVGTSNLHIYAAMRGQSLEDFQKTRNAQVLYSVAGRDEGKTDWDKKAD